MLNFILGAVAVSPSQNENHDDNDARESWSWQVCGARRVLVSETQSYVVNSSSSSREIDKEAAAAGDEKDGERHHHRDAELMRRQRRGVDDVAAARSSASDIYTSSLIRSASPHLASFPHPIYANVTLITRWQDTSVTLLLLLVWSACLPHLQCLAALSDKSVHLIQSMNVRRAAAWE